MYYFVTVNFGTSDLVQNWADSIRTLHPNSRLVLVDNFHSSLERATIQELCSLLDIDLVCSDNVGYGAGLNRGIETIATKEGGMIFAGNLDLTFHKIPDNLGGSLVSFVPEVIENGRRNRNPFLTLLQKRFLFTYNLAAVYESSVLYYLAVVFNRFLGLFPSPLWAVHGSLFCFTTDFVREGELPFNSESFLYAEELEFASYVETSGANWEFAEIQVFHTSHAATSGLIKKHKNYMRLWAPSFMNWRRRW